MKSKSFADKADGSIFSRSCIIHVTHFSLSSADMRLGPLLSRGGLFLYGKNIDFADAYSLAID
jgi:hypothetical protein